MDNPTITQESSPTGASPAGYRVVVPNNLENSGLDTAVFATHEEAESALECLRGVYSDHKVARCEVVRADKEPNTTFAQWSRC
jgi:hypothetical protein